MYEQIASNKRRSAIYVVVFFLVWIGAGAALGLGALHPSGGGAADWAPVVGGGVFAGIIALVVSLFTLAFGTSIVLAISGARRADPVQYQQLHNIVEALAIGDGLPKPGVYVIQDQSPNAFATGTSPRRAAITVTTALLSMMTRDELEGVIAHEMSHIKNFDVRLLLIISTLVGLAAMLASLLWRGMGRIRFRGKGGGQIGLFILAAAIVLSIVGFVVGPLIRFAVSRRRETLADMSSVALTRNPAGLIGALEKLAANDTPFAHFNHATASMCIDDPLDYQRKWHRRLFTTHPPIAERIALLRQMSHAAPDAPSSAAPGAP